MDGGKGVAAAGGQITAPQAWCAVTAAGHLAWEVAQLPLYRLWTSAPAYEIALDVGHCFLGDLLIAIFSLGAAIAIWGDWSWPAGHFAPVAATALAFGLVWTAFSEWRNIELQNAWAYSEWMPTIPIPGFDLGLSPVSQWIVVPACAMLACRRARRAGG